MNMSDISAERVVLFVVFSVIGYLLISTFNQTSLPHPLPPIAPGTTILHTFRFLQDPHELSLSLSDRYKTIVTLILGGSARFHLLFDHVSGLTDMYKRDSTFDIRYFLRHFNTYVEEMPAEFNNDEATKEKFRLATVRSLRSTPIIEDLSTRFQTSFLSRLKNAKLPNLPSSDPGSATLQTPGVDLDFVPFFRRIVFAASAESIFGPYFPSDDLYETFTEFESKLPHLMKRYPRTLFPKGFEARDYVIQVLENFFQNKDADGKPFEVDALQYVSPVIKNHLKLFNDKNTGNYVREGIANFMLGILVASVSNVVNSSLWMTLFVFESPETLARVNSILESAFDQDVDDFDWPSLYNNPLLKSMLKETLRLKANSSSAREVKKDTTITVADDKQYSLKKGDIIIVPSDVIHWSEKFYPEPTKWKSDRFINHLELGETHQSKAASAEESNEKPNDIYKTFDDPIYQKQQEILDKIRENNWKTYLPWGGGNHMCPGRFFAANEMIIQLVYTVWYLNLKFKEPIPEGYIKDRFGLGAIHPEKGMLITVSRKRNIDKPYLQ